MRTAGQYFSSPETHASFIRGMQPVRKLTNEQVREIREADLMGRGCWKTSRPGCTTMHELARKFGVSHNCVFKCRHRVTYRHLP